MVVNGHKLLQDIDSGRVKLSKDSMLVQATPESVKKLKNKIVNDIVEDCRHSISRASAEIVKNESLIRELIKSGKISEKHLRKILQKERIGARTRNYRSSLNSYAVSNATALYRRYASARKTLT